MSTREAEGGASELLTVLLQVEKRRCEEESHADLSQHPTGGIDGLKKLHINELDTGIWQNCSLGYCTHSL